MKKVFITIFWAILIMTSSDICAQNYRLTRITHERLLVDKRFDVLPDTVANSFLAPYKQKVDSIMSPVVGISARYMPVSRPESLLSDLLADILLNAAWKYHEKVDLAVYNIGGIRSALPQGKVTYGDILDIAPFENKICFLSLTGEKLMELFRQIAFTHGEGVSHGVELVITSNGGLISAKLNGMPIVKNKKYRISTIDYLAQGNDKLEAFKDATDKVMPAGSENNVRDIIIDYFRQREARDLVVDSKMEGRIVVVNYENK